MKKDWKEIDGHIINQCGTHKAIKKDGKILIIERGYDFGGGFKGDDSVLHECDLDMEDDAWQMINEYEMQNEINMAMLEREMSELGL